MKYLPGGKFHGRLCQLVSVNAEDAAAPARLQPTPCGEKGSVQLAQCRRPGEQQGPSRRRVGDLLDRCLEPGESKQLLRREEIEVPLGIRAAGQVDVFGKLSVGQRCRNLGFRHQRNSFDLGLALALHLQKRSLNVRRVFVRRVGYLRSDEIGERIDVVMNPVPVCQHCLDCGYARPSKRVEDGIPGFGEMLDVGADNVRRPTCEVGVYPVVAFCSLPLCRDAPRYRLKLEGRSHESLSKRGAKSFELYDVHVRWSVHQIVSHAQNHSAG